MVVDLRFVEVVVEKVIAVAFWTPTREHLCVMSSHHLIIISIMSWNRSTMSCAVLCERVCPRGLFESVAFLSLSACFHPATEFGELFFHSVCLLLFRDAARSAASG